MAAIGAKIPTSFQISNVDPRPILSSAQPIRPIILTTASVQSLFKPISIKTTPRNRINHLLNKISHNNKIILEKISFIHNKYNIKIA
ncbi:MAG: hypothetical protein BWY70_01891 [Bacteroidetes bacterium ADurb.Bin408]|nr:MAG: hypothetical protein BWY70_01891 [Bacteroidetes bacterium ADurb.Bin408]